MPGPGQIGVSVPEALAVLDALDDALALGASGMSAVLTARPGFEDRLAEYRRTRAAIASRLTVIPTPEEPT
jgi:hypothetical protein